MIVTGRSALLVAGLILLFALLQSAFFGQVEFLGVSAWILPLCCVVFGLFGGSLVGATIGFTLGFLADASGAGPMGLSSLVFMAIGYLAGTHRERGGRADLKTAAILAMAATLAANLAFLLYSAFTGMVFSLGFAFLPGLILQTVYAGLLSVPVFFLIRRVLRPALIHDSAPIQEPRPDFFDLEAGPDS